MHGAVETEFSEIRFKGDKDRAATVYAGYEALKAEDIADVVSYVINAPKHVTIADMTIYPSAQASYPDFQKIDIGLQYSHNLLTFITLQDENFISGNFF